MTKEEFQILAQKHAQGQCSPEEKDRLLAFYDRLQKTGKTPQWTLEKEEQIRVRILQNISSQLNAPKQTIRISFSKVAAGIVLLMVAGLAFYLSRQQVDNIPEVKYASVETDLVHRRTVTLTDGTVVRLNANSKLTYPESFSDTLRQVLLEGEAFFEVRRDTAAPFIVKTADLTTTVLGTSFNVRAFRGQNEDVTVVEGKVSVADERKSVVITKGEQAYFNNSVLTQRGVDLNFYAGWFSKKINFNLTQFDKVLEQLSRWYNVEFSYSEGTSFSKDCAVRAQYSNEGLVKVLDGLKNIIAFDYKINDDKTITITNTGCFN